MTDRMTVAQARALLEQQGLSGKNPPMPGASAPSPKDGNTSDLWLRLTQRPRPHKFVDFPTRPGEESPGKVAMVVLTESELHTCRANAQRTAQEILRGGDAGPLYVEKGAEQLGYLDIYQNELVVQLVCASCKAPEDPTLQIPAFLTPKHARQKLTTDEFAVLLNAYTKFRRECGPFLSELTTDEMEAWIAVLKESGSRIPLARLSGEALSDLVMFLVSKVTSPTASGSAGSPPGALSSEGASPVSDLVDPHEVSTPDE